MTDATIVHVPGDSAARSVGADALAAAVQALAAENGWALDLRRPGSRGLYWLEPLIEVEMEGVRVAFGPLDSRRVNELFDETGRPDRLHHSCLGPADNIPALTCQARLTFERVGVIEPLALDQYESRGGLKGLEKAISMTPQHIVDAVKTSGLRGRGGAAFPTGIKWQTVLDTPSAQKYVVCNADEGDSGTFADRMIMESDPYALLEGMAIAGMATGATHGIIYLRAEYPQAIATMNEAITLATDAGWLGANAMQSGRDFTCEVRVAAGSYICGEETAMLESIEGKRGMVRFRPPLPAVKGLFGKPTVVNNVISLATAPTILARGAQHYRDFGSGDSRGTLTLQLAGNVARGGLYELPFGITLREVIEDLGGGTASGRPVRAVQAGGPLGAFIPPEHFDTPMDYESFKAIGGMLGHGGVVVFDDRTDMGALARFAMEFCALESCGKCTPCRIGARRGVEVIDRIRAGDNAQANRELLGDLCQTMIDGSLCALGGMAPFPVQSVLRHFAEDL